MILVAQKITKSVQATRDFHTLLKLSKDTDESWGILPPPPTGAVSFSNVSFAYSERPDAPVLKGLSMHVADGECVAIVGSSGSGKSTIAALLQRLYEPEAGSVLIGSTDLRMMDVHQLREQVAVVSQHPHLFDATVAENIAYGCQGVSAADVVKAAQSANVDEFVKGLPQGYDTLIGDDAVLLSSGQAQRLQIARALVRPGRVLILDECTSALDAENQAAVMDTVRRAKVGRTTIMVTHKLPVMQMCDRIVVVCEGRVAEEGTYEELMRRKGVFRTLANAGEWQGE
jgi:ATP-binding cassette subfamily B (MDR/TAP) protein 1